jgi:hypothetical protein
MKAVRVALAGVALVFANMALAQAVPETKRDISPSITDAKQQFEEKARTESSRESFEEKKEHKVRRVPLPRKKGTPEAAAAAPAQPAPPPKKLKAKQVIQFEGIGKGLNYPIHHAPPDTNGAVSEDHYIQWVNEAFAVFDKKTGKAVLAPTDGNVLWSKFGGNCENFNDGDPITLYDRAAKRWVMTQFAVEKGPPFSQCIAISKSSDPLGQYYRYEFKFPDFNDYPKFGVWPDGYYASFNMFHGKDFAGAKTCVFDRARMLKGEEATMQCFDLPDYAGLLPADWDGARPPPDGSPNYLLGFGDNELNLWRFKVDWSDPKKSKLDGPRSIAVASFDPACGETNCIRQPQGEDPLEPLSDRLMYRLAYRNFGTHESLVVNHTVKAGASTGVRWYELRDPNGQVKVQQQGTYAPDSLFRWIGSLAMDKQGNVLMGYSASSSSVFPSIRYAGRSASDPANAMSIEEKAVAGLGAQQNGLERWGDYSSMSIDPADDCTFWFTSQYLPKSGSFNWSTKIIAVKFDGCQ